MLTLDFPESLIIVLLCALIALALHQIRYAGHRR